MSAGLVNFQWKTVDDVRRSLMRWLTRQQWRTYTPTWTGSGSNPAIGNGELVGAYMFDWNLMHVAIRMRAGSTTTFGSGRWTFSLPAALQSRPDLTLPGISAAGVAIDIGTRSYPIIARVEPGNNYATVVSTTLGTGTSGDVDSDTPFTWATNDVLNFNLSFPWEE